MSNLTDPKNLGIDAILAKLGQVLQLWWDADEREKLAEKVLAEAKENKATADVQLKGCFDAANLFGFDLKFEWDKRREQQRERQAQVAAAAMPSVEVGAGLAFKEVPLSSAPKSIKDYAIDAAKQAWPNPIRVSILRQQLETIGIKTHQKTIGMTLYRLLKEGLLRRRGRDWFFVPEDGRMSASSSVNEENPEDQSGLFETDNIEVGYADAYNQVD
jgi:hypothetical protein